MSDLAAEIAEVAAQAERVYTRTQVEAAFDRMAAEINATLAQSNPLLLAILVGGMYPALQLAMRLSFPHQLDYAHVTRYQGQLSGGDVEWRSQPRLPVAGRVVLVVDDILDEGLTLAQVMQQCARLGAARVLSAVLVRKVHDRPMIGHADYYGLEVDDRYVFGCGMDYKEYFRGLPEIYAVASS